MTKTLSEYLFERVCDEHGIPWIVVPREATAKTPDYELFAETTPVVVEVKEIDPSEEELRNDRLVQERGWGDAIGHTPGDRLRLKIAAASKQIKARTLGKKPSLLVAFDPRGEIPHVEPYSVKVAMYGLEQIHIAVPRPGMGSPYATGMSFGPKRKMTPNHNTSISGIGVLVMPNSGSVVLLVYHNRYARTPLPPEVLARFGVRQFVIEEPSPGTTGNWREFLADSSAA